MAQVTFTIPDDQVDRVKEAIIGLFPIPTVIDEETEETIPEFTPAEWLKEKIRRWIIQQVHRYEEVQAVKTAKESVIIDDDLAI